MYESQKHRAQKAMTYYFEKSNLKKFRGRPLITLPSSIHSNNAKELHKAK